MRIQWKIVVCHRLYFTILPVQSACRSMVYSFIERHEQSSYTFFSFKVQATKIINM